MCGESSSADDKRKKTKRLIVLCDGTGQSSSRAGTESSFPTNVKNFGDCLPQSAKNNKGEEVEQVIFYQSGIGTSTVSVISRALASGVAYGIEDNILDAYYFLCSNYEPGDEIFIFGFSRGAFIARILANMVVRMGLLRMNVSWIIRKAWVQYMKQDDGKSFDSFLEMLHKDEKTYIRRVRVKVLGVWDTVAAVGLTSSCQQFDTKLHWGIENVFHALALDEKRFAFSPTLFYLPEDIKPPWLVKLDEDDSKRTPGIIIDTKICNLKQCWFAGAHTDIGGGYASSHQSNITLAWMIDNCQHLRLLGFNACANFSEECKKKGRKWKKIINGHHRPFDVKYGNSVQELSTATLEQEYPGWACGIVRDSYAEFHWSLRWRYRSPGNYMTPNIHPGPWGISIIPITSVATVFGYLAKPVVVVSGYLARGYLTAASYVLPPDSNGSQNLPKSDGNTCIHPSCSPLPPQRVTNERIHQSVYTRWKEASDARSKCQPSFVKRFARYMTDQKPVRKFLAFICRDSDIGARDRSEWLANWNPESLEGFRHVDGEPENGKPAKWIGKCAVTGAEFEIPEEPEKICEHAGLMQDLNINHKDKIKGHPKGLFWHDSKNPLGNNWQWWLEDDVDFAECNAIGLKKYVNEENTQLQPRWFFKRWLGLGAISHGKVEAYKIVSENPEGGK